MFDIQHELKRLPEKPGVYLMKDENGDVIYVGKAVVLKNRVRQYFQNSSNQHPKVQAMVLKIKSFEYIITHNELEALILECNLIKKYKPKFNILLKDDKGYPYIKITMNEDYPRVMMARNITKDGAEYFGPYSNKSAVRETIGFLKKLFPMKSCNKVLPRDIGKSRPCLNFHIAKCLGPCKGDIDKDEYRSAMKDICSFLKGKHEILLKKLEDSMKKASENMQYELAAVYRDKLNSIKHIFQKQKVVLTSLQDIDVIGFEKDEFDSIAQIFFIRNGNLIGREHFVLEGLGGATDEEIITSFLKQFYDRAAFIPEEILIQYEISDKVLIEKWLSKKKASKVTLKVPKRGEKLNLLKMVLENVKDLFNRYIENRNSQSSFYEEVLKKLSLVLGLDRTPYRIEAYDVSNTGSTEIVASMVVCQNGILTPSEYRRFKIKGSDTQNDYASIQEVLHRRFKRIGKGFSNIPDLIMIDGGTGHVNAANEVLRQQNTNIPVCGMVKDKKHRTRGLVINRKEFDLSKDKNLFRFVSMIQNETHRFAISYNKKLVEKRYTKSVLDEIEGIGEQRRKALIKYFGGVANIKKATLHDLIQVQGISESVAQNIYNYFNEA